MACEYCKEEKPIIVNDSIRVAIDDYRKEMYVNYYDQMWDCVKTPITHCPKCGEKLGDE